LGIGAHEDVAAALTDRAMAAWRALEDVFPDDLLPELSREQQAAREDRLDLRLAGIEEEMDGVETGTGMEVGSITGWLAQISACALDLEDDAEIQPFLRDGLARISCELAREARKLDPGIGGADILQAARNAWTACALQQLLGRPVRLTPAVFAYSMLYPYSDNYLDDPAVTRGEKERFGERFGKRLAGGAAMPRGTHESIIWKLVGLIECEYPRDRFPQVYAALLAIHGAQQASIGQVRQPMQDTLDVARATFWKGGSSVLADAYLAAGTLTPGEAEAAFDWGVTLQLNDDLQDFHADRARGSRTLFTEAAEVGGLDGLTNRLLMFSPTATDRLARLAGGGPSMGRLLAGSSRLLTIRSAAHAGDFYTPSYLERLDAGSPLRLEFLRTRERRLGTRSERYAKLWFALG
jgi:hypothetical protein